MAKKDKSLLGSILKGAVDITGEVIKTGYNVATSKEAKKIYKPYIYNRVKKLPFVTGKLAISKDNFIYSKKKKKNYKHTF